jgi:branched-chain amino acid transport system ATP-binding protein
LHQAAQYLLFNPLQGSADEASVFFAAETYLQMNGQDSVGAPLLRCDNVRVTFGGITALDGVSFDVGRGQIVGIIGPNGAGKTTLFNCISRLYSVTSGDIAFDGESLMKTPRHKIAGLGIARTFQNVALFESMTVRENILVGSHPKRIEKGNYWTDALHTTPKRDIEEAHAEAIQLMELMQLTADANKRVSALPFGTRKRVELARALASHPKLLMLDEPAGGLTHGDVDELRLLIQDMRERFNLTVLVVEHHMHFVMNLCQKIVALNFGKRIAWGTPREIQDNQDVIIAYLGAPPSTPPGEVVNQYVGGTET